MGKKKFTDGLNDLFSDTQETRGGSSLSEITVQHPKERKPHQHYVKSFAHDLDALLQEAMDESMDRMASNNRPTIAPSKSKTSLGREGSVFSGLDALIRETIDVQDFAREEDSGVKRLTVSVDRSKLEKLKAIARLENAYLKDILVELIDEYIVEYTRDKGLSL